MDFSKQDYWWKACLLENGYRW